MTEQTTLSFYFLYLSFPVLLVIPNRFYSPRNAGYGHQVLTDGIIKDGLWDVYNQFQ